MHYFVRQEKNCTRQEQERTVVITLSEQLKQGQVNELNKRLKQFSDKIAEINSKLDNPRSTTDKRLEAIKARINELLLPQYHFSEMIDFEYETKEVQDPVILKK